MNENNTVNEIIEKVSEMYRKTIREAQDLSKEYDKVLAELNTEEITHNRYIQLESMLEIIGGETNNKYHVAQGISDVREMLFELLK